MKRAYSVRTAGRLWSLLLGAILLFLIAYPTSMLLIGALTKTNPVVEGISLTALTLQNFYEIALSATVRNILFNTIVICFLGTVIAVVIGVGFAWIVTRTNTPWKPVIEMAGILPLFVPPLVGGIAWSLLGSPTTGLLNTLLSGVGLNITINAYSFLGVVCVFGIYYAPYVYMFVASSLKNMDPSLEEAAEMTGASALRTMLTVTLPLITPAIVSGALLSFIVMLGIYGIPKALGTPAGIEVLTTYIFSLVSWSPPLYNTAAAAAMVLVILTAFCVLLQHFIVSGKSYVTVSGKSFRPKELDLGRWKWVTLSLSVLYILVVVVLPYAALSVAAFRNFMFIPDVASLFDVSKYTTTHFNALFNMPLVWGSIWNTLEVGAIAGVIGTTLAFAMSYTVVRSDLPGRRVLETMAMIPIAIPGLVIGVAYLWAWIGLPGGLWGTTLIIALALVSRFLPDTMKIMSSSLMQIHKELEEASWICGSGKLRTIYDVIFPLVRPGVFAAVTLLFVLTVRELGSSLFLITNDTMVMAVLLLDLYEGGNIGIASAFSILQSVMLLLVIVIGRMIEYYSSPAR